MSSKQLKTMKKDATSQSASAGSGTFLTQKGEKIGEVKKEIEELQILLQSSTQTSQSTLLLRKRKEMREVDFSLDLTKKDYKKRMDDCEARRALFEGKQLKMREQVLKFEKFIQENDAKKLKAEAKAKLERQLFAEKSKIMGTLKLKLGDLEKSKEQLVIELDIKRRYWTYLLQTVEAGEGYEEVPEILSRYSILQDANQELMVLNGEQENETDEFRVKLQALKTAMQNKSLVSNSVIHRYQAELEDKREFVHLKVVEKYNLEDKKKDISRDYSQVAQAIKNLFTRCQSSIRTNIIVASVKTNHPLNTSIVEELDNELDVIYSRLTDLVEISDEFRTDFENIDINTINSGETSLQATANSPTSRSIFS